MSVRRLCSLRSLDAFVPAAYSAVGNSLYASLWFGQNRNKSQ